jgi:putative membrane protein
MNKHLSTGIKGVLMGAANVIPGVSGGTVALLTGIFHPLINALKSFDLTALRLLKERRFSELALHIQLPFLAAVGTGIVVSILTFSRLLDYLFTHYALHVWSFFFGLIIASVYFVWKEIRQVTLPILLLFGVGTAIAAGITLLTPAEENASILYLFICGVIAICSMILPGLSGSYVLLLMGNYQLVMIDAVVHMRLEVLLPVAAGAAVGMAVFARVLNWVFARFHDATIALLTGFIFGSLSTLWPWKTAVIQTFQVGDRMKEKVTSYTYAWPEWNRQTAIALGVMIAGALILVLTEKAAKLKKRD